MTAQTLPSPEADPEDFDFDAIMEGADWFHWAVSLRYQRQGCRTHPSCLRAAKRHGVTVSVDLNFRKKLWTKEKLSLSCVLSYGTLMSASATRKTPNSVSASNLTLTLKAADQCQEGYKEAFSRLWLRIRFQICHLYPPHESFSATHNGWKAMIYSGEEFLKSSATTSTRSSTA